MEQSSTQHEKKNDLVIFREENIAQSHWPLGVIKMYPGRDGVVH